MKWDRNKNDSLSKNVKMQYVALTNNQQYSKSSVSRRYESWTIREVKTTLRNSSSNFCWAY